MKKLFLTCVIAAIVFVLCSAVNAGPTTGLSQSESQSSVTYIKDSEDSNFFLEHWFYWFLDDVFGWDRRGSWHYNDGNSGSVSDSGGVDWGSGGGDSGSGSGDVDWDSGSGDGDSGSGSGDVDWDSGSGDGDSDSGSGGVDWDSGSGDGDWDSGSGGVDWDSGSDDGDWDSGSGGVDWDSGSGSGDWDSGSGGGDWDSGSGGGDWDSGSGGGWGYDDTNSNPVQSIPAPGALVLGSIGVSIISWLRRRRTL